MIVILLLWNKSDIHNRQIRNELFNQVGLHKISVL